MSRFSSVKLGTFFWNDQYFVLFFCNVAFFVYKKIGYFVGMFRRIEEKLSWWFSAMVHGILRKGVHKLMNLYTPYK